MKEVFKGPLERVTDYCWRIPKSYKPGMRVDGLIYASSKQIRTIREDLAPEQVANVAFLPGIQYASIAMPDIHWGYGFSIGGVCATDPEEDGVICPGGIGYDINCGVRLVATNLHLEEVRPVLRQLVEELFKEIPTGVGRSGRYYFDKKELRHLMRDGVSYLFKKGLATQQDIDHTEENGKLVSADPDAVSDRALERGAEQCGTLGSGNHFLEVQVVDEVVDEAVALVMGIEVGQVVVMIHSGSRGLGYQVCEDALKSLRKATEKYSIQLPDKQLACAPIKSSEGQQYLAAMSAAANFAWCNRQLLMWQTREVFERFFGRSWQQLGMRLVYDVAHNIAKFEQHSVNNTVKTVCVHRKGATRAFPAGHADVPSSYRSIGQPVIIPGDMGRSSWLLVGTEGSLQKTFGTTCHGAGRVLSRSAAVKQAEGHHISKELEDRGVIARARSWKGLAEEMPAAYKDVDEVVDVVERAGITRKVARMRPIGVIKG
ncbi:MAG: RtcB family protein [Acidobacteriota bacterium]|nr:RtcB family protein [Blastocatellia bacterium]MDW8412927.1 RtcB family protein [Acidobacteriota bacterium]